MLVTFREHAAPDLCIFHEAVTITAEAEIAGQFGRTVAISALFTSQYKPGTALWYLKC